MTVNRCCSHRAACAVALTAVLLMSACGGGGSASSSQPPTDSLLPAGGSSTSADNLTDRQIQRQAVDSMAGLLGLDVTELGSTFDPDLGSPLSEEGALNNPTPLYNENNKELLSISLGLSEADTQSIVRTGNSLLIDLDENQVCRRLFESIQEVSSCSFLMQHVTVTIDAASEDSGIVAYQYRGEPLVRVGYAPHAGSYELNLKPLVAIAQDQYVLTGNRDIVPVYPERFEGVVRFSQAADPEFPDDLGSIELQITEPVRIVSEEENLQVNIDVATLLSLGMTDAGGAFEFNLGALEVSSPVNGVDSPLIDINLPGLTGRAEIQEANGDLVVTNLGLSNGPISLSINSGDAVRIALETFGFTVSEQEETVTLTGNLYADVLLDNTLGTVLEETSLISALLQVAAPTGTIFGLSETGPIKLLQGGPFTVWLEETYNDGTIQNSLEVQAGDCFGGADSDDPVDVNSSVDGVDPSDAGEQSDDFLDVVPCSD